CFFFQAEDGIRDFHVTGVQTCALPICRHAGARHRFLLHGRSGARMAARGSNRRVAAIYSRRTSWGTLYNRMDRALKERIVGAVVLVAIVVLVVPVFLDGPPPESRTTTEPVTLPGPSPEPGARRPAGLDRDRDQPMPEAPAPDAGRRAQPAADAVGSARNARPEPEPAPAGAGDAGEEETG